MKEIATIDKKLDAEEIYNSVSKSIIAAYNNSRRYDNDALNFDEPISEYEVQEIIEFCNQEGIDEITVSASWEGLTDILWEFMERGCTISGMTKVRAESDIYNRVTAYEGEKTAIVISIR